ncbi:DNA cytosine methyltransferase [Marivirga harenae]|uniref:DNA cytosine methyltransferase n=1 Tax=Marivirga harenae TaxID=2010992 RepID=UPI0026E07700|nr:DNA cytosine methyltransferase [Marivirga harenae]WKV11450.1 DNA cytosine methyltransferase [Marivirga harenae]
MQGIKFIDLFAGAGGFSLGFEKAGYELIAAVEKDEWASETLRTNHKKGDIIQGDIERISPDLRFKNAEVIIGGPPCQGFSIAGPSKDPNDPRNSLFMYFAKWVDEIKPFLFVMENVSGILTKRNASGTKIIDIIRSTFESINYTVNIWKLNAADYGVPQSRDRVFIVGSKNGDMILPPPRTHAFTTSDDSLLSPVTVGDALFDLPWILAKEGKEVQDYTLPTSNKYQSWCRAGSEKVYNHVAMQHTRRLIDRFREIQAGNELGTLSSELRVRQRSGNGKLSKSLYNSNYRHLDASKVSYTIPASFYSSFIHPNIPRNLTAREAARLQSFPDNYIFKGKRTLVSKKLLERNGKEYKDCLSQYNQVGNAVPPLLAYAIAKHLLEYLITLNISSKNDFNNIRSQELSIE